MNYIDSRRVWSCSYWSQWQDFHETRYTLTIHLIVPREAMKISSGRRQARETRRADSAAGPFSSSTPALKPITALKCCFGSRDQQRGGAAVVPAPGDPWQLSTPPGDSARRSAVPSPRPELQLKLIWHPVPATGEMCLLRVEADLPMVYTARTALASALHLNFP